MSTQAPFAYWNYQDTYTVYIKASALTNFSTSDLTGDNALWTVAFVHNSPSKPSLCPATTTTAPKLAVTDKKVDKKNVKITITNTGTADAFLSGLTITWPQAANGNLVQVKLGPNVLYSTSTGGGSLTLTAAQLPSDQNKLKIPKGGPGGGHADLTFVFQNNASTTLSQYTGTASFGASNLTILP